MRPYFVTLTVLTLVGCGGSQTSHEQDWAAEPVQETRPLREETTLTGSLPLYANEGQSKVGVVGVRHDLMLAKGPQEARCSCLAVAVGNPDDPRFFWMGSIPKVASDIEVVAIGAQGVSCPGGDSDERRRRPSISAVERVGDDVFIEVEDLPLGRPLASGAVIARPGPKGALFIHPRSSGMVYGRGLASSRCRVQ